MCARECPVSRRLSFGDRTCCLQLFLILAACHWLNACIYPETAACRLYVRGTAFEQRRKGQREWWLHRCIR
ncbi:hypothetical protein V1520DRAFT_331524 [Lipomyces starkeyi]